MQRMLARDTAIAAISALIVLILGAQLVAGFVVTGPRGWPIINYPMYKNARFDGDRLDHRFQVDAVLADGTRLNIDPDELGMSFWLFQHNVVIPVQQGKREALAPTLERYCERSEARLRRLEVLDSGVAISAAGPVVGLERELLGAIDVACPEVQQR